MAKLWQSWWPRQQRCYRSPARCCLLQAAKQEPEGHTKPRAPTSGIDVPPVPWNCSHIHCLLPAAPGDLSTTKGFAVTWKSETRLQKRPPKARLCWNVTALLHHVATNPFPPSTGMPSLVTRGRWLLERPWLSRTSTSWLLELLGQPVGQFLPSAATARAVCGSLCPSCAHHVWCKARSPQRKPWVSNPGAGGGGGTGTEPARP